MVQHLLPPLSPFSPLLPPPTTAVSWDRFKCLQFTCFQVVYKLEILFNHLDLFSGYNAQFVLYLS